MRTLLLTVAMCAALVACDKGKKTSADETGSAAAMGSAAMAQGSAAMEAAGSALEAAGKAAALAGSAAEMAGSAAQAAGASAELAAKAAAMGAAAAANVPRPASVTDAEVALADKLVAVMEKMSAGITAAGADCAKAATAIKAGADTLKPLKADIDKWEKHSKDDPAIKQWFEANYMSKMMSAMGPTMAVAQTCGTDKAFTEAMKSLDTN